MIIGFPFSAVQSSAFRISLIFSVPQNQMPRTEAFGEFAGIFDGAVVFFIRGEDFPVAVEAEGFVEEPVGATGKFFAERVQRFVAGQQTILPSGSTARKPNWRALVE